MTLVVLTLKYGILIAMRNGFAAKLNCTLLRVVMNCTCAFFAVLRPLDIVFS